MKVSFIIRFKNEEKHIKNCVETIMRQKGGFERELIFVNDSTTDSSLEYVKDLQKNPPANATVKLIDLEPGTFTYSNAINVALPEVTGEFVVILTVHVDLEGDEAIVHMLENFEDPKVVGVSPRTIPSNQANTFSRLSLSKTSFAYKIIRSSEFFVYPDDRTKLTNYLFSVVFSCIRASVLKEKKNWFKEVPRAEDLDWSYRMINQGYSIVYDPRVVVLHHNEDDSTHIANRWIYAVVSLELILRSKIPTKMQILKRAGISITAFMLSVILAEKKITKKLVYLCTLFVVYFKILNTLFMHFDKVSKWEKLYTESLSLQ